MNPLNASRPRAASPARRCLNAGPLGAHSHRGRSSRRVLAAHPGVANTTSLALAAADAAAVQSASQAA